ncbi:hypothetical protein [Ottowia sp.]|uniref:hypothetical protein n=1 Tax=Ottowia sp. TaxID=1898956 RepID=UPI003A8A24D3
MTDFRPIEERNSRWGERAVLTALLRDMALAGVAAVLWVGVQAMRGPQQEPELPSVRVSKLLPGSFITVDAPVRPRGAPAALKLKLLVLRQPDGLVRGYFLPAEQGRAMVPVAGSLVGGVPCDDFAPDFTAQDIGCRQARPGFEFALRHRWALDGRALTPGTPALLAVCGHEVAGDWALEADLRCNSLSHSGYGIHISRARSK